MTDQSLRIQQLPVNALYALHKKIISTQVRAHRAGHADNSAVS